MLRVFLIITSLWASAAHAAPQRYTFETGASQITFSFDLEGNTLNGNVPVAQADVVIDFDDLSRSNISVVFDMTRATAGVIFATQAMKSTQVLATESFPTARFQSTRVTRAGDGARLVGNLTLRGVTQPVVLDAVIYRARGSDPGDLSRLVLLLTGTVSRSAFGASGYAALVADPVQIRAVTSVARQD